MILPEILHLPPTSGVSFVPVIYITEQRVYNASRITNVQFYRCPLMRITVRCGRMSSRASKKIYVVILVT